MAAFDTEDPKTNDPSYLGYSQGTEKAGLAPIPMPRDLTIPTQPRKQADTSLGELFKNFGEVAGKSIDAVDTVVKLSAEKTLQQGIDKIRDDFGVADAADISKSGPPPISVLGAEGAPIPPAVSKVGNQVQGLYDAYSQGKLSNSYYYGRLEAFVRQVREQYPGYRDYIDSTVSKITGVTPANALRTALLQDTTELYKKLQAGADKKETWERQHSGELQAVFPDYIERNVLKTGKEQPYSFEQLVAGHAAWDAKNKKIDAQHKELVLKQSQRKDTSEEAETVATQELTDFTRGMISDSMTKVGVGNLGTLVESINKSINSGQGPKPEEEAQLRGQLNNMTLQAEQGIDRKLNNPAYRGLSPTQKEALRKDAMIPINQIKDALLNKEYGTLMMNASIVKSMENQTALDLYKTSPVWALTDVLRQKVGNEGLAQVLMQPGSQLLQQQFQGIRTFFLAKAVEGKGATAEEAVKQLFEMKVKDGNIYNSIVSDPLFLLKSDKTGKEAIPGLVDFLFSPSNNMLQWVDPNPSKGPSRSQVYERLIAPDVTERMFQLGKDKPEVWSKYQDWAISNFKVMFKENANDLSEMAKNNQYYQSPSYDPDKNEVYLKNQRNYTVRSDKVDNMNAALRAIQPVFLKAGKKLSEEMPQLLAEMGVHTISVPEDTPKKK